MQFNGMLPEVHFVPLEILIKIAQKHSKKTFSKKKTRSAVIISGRRVSLNVLLLLMVTF